MNIAAILLAFTLAGGASIPASKPECGPVPQPRLIERADGNLLLEMDDLLVRTAEALKEANRRLEACK